VLLYVASATDIPTTCAAVIVKTVLSWHVHSREKSVPVLIAACAACTAIDIRVFKYPQEVRTLIYTTNAIENFNRQLRKVTKAKSVFPTDDSLLKMLYLAMIDITKKWTGRRKDWGQVHSQLEIFFADRLD